MAIKSLSDLQPYREAIIVLAQEHGARHIRVFGSVARGEARSDSDIDFLVQWDYEQMSAWGGVGLDLALEELLGCSVDVISETGLSPLFKEDVLKEAILL
ncbi:MAG: nucleotidyltransferase domain-containing protein [Anaerolineae bacterium]|nr:nucleotidyltransferase domain-containing protein [Anaerolineae bacterium]MDQ7037471.1 nucleotidyltransferase domain-containing protein [Anaerolineae bacterium]